MDICKMMEIDPPAEFATKDDEVKYWMEVAREMYQRSESTLSELQEYQESSQFLEKELESSFWETDQKNRRLSTDNLKLIENNSELRAKLSEQIAAYSALQNELQALNVKGIELINNIRNLEQKNDDLERDNRALKMLEQDMEIRYNDAIEKIALLETDLLEENYSKFDVERLEKENQDLKKRIDEIEKNSKSECIRPRKDANQARAPVRRRSSCNIAYGPFKLITENQSEPEPRRNMDVDLATSPPVKVKRKVAAEIPIVQAARAEKYNTEGRNLSQAFTRYSTQQKDKDRSTMNGNVEMRTKKVKDEEKRQRVLSSFIKRIRTARNQLLRRNE